MHGFDYGFAGHLTVRDPERPQLYWTNPMCVHFSQVKMSNLVLADHLRDVRREMHFLCYRTAQRDLKKIVAFRRWLLAAIENGAPM